MTLLATCSTQQIPQGTPQRLTVLPRTDVIRGKDGRAWKLGDRAALLATLNAQGPVLVDIGHGSVTGANAQAAGWLSDFRFEEDGLTGAVEWTPIGEELLSKKAFRYLSPTLQYDTTGATSDILGTVRTLHSVGLVNTPNLQGLSALNNESDYQVEAVRKWQEGIGTETSIPPDYSWCSREIVAQWPAYLADLKRNLKHEPEGHTLSLVWQSFIGLVGAAERAANEKASEKAFKAAETRAKAAAMNSATATNTAPARRTLDAADLKICRQLGLTEEQYLGASGERVGTNAAATSSGLDATDLKICRLMGVKPADYQASGPRRR